MTLWSERMSRPPADALLAFTTSLAVDVRLAADDVAGSRAHVRGLGRCGLLGEDEVKAILRALDMTESELASGQFAFKRGDEDIHTAIERRVTEIAGPVGAKIHTGRSRNDQVATDLRLWVCRELAEVAQRVMDFQQLLLEGAEAAEDTYLPGYTHLQRAQPVLLAHHLLAHGWALGRDVDRLLATCERASVCPLGAGALAGSSLPIDPDFTASELGFRAPFENSLDAVSDRDFVAEALFDLALLGVHLSRLGEEVVLWSSAEFGFLQLDDAWSTGSSMLPQKKNPDVAELARGKAGRLIGNLTGLLVTLKGLPLAYNRDLQEDKEPLFDSVDQIRLALAALGGLLAASAFNADRMAAAADGESIGAVDLAEWLVSRGTPFRAAHAAVARLVRRAGEEDKPLAELVEADPALGPEAAELLGPGWAVTRRRTPGGGGPGPVAAQLDQYRLRLARDRARAQPAVGLDETPAVDQPGVKADPHPPPAGQND
ncbi:MAG: argininosuccinate lyase [Acidimicrobiales bacterium]